MGFRRRIEPLERLEDDALTAALVGVGMQFAAEPAVHPPIEDVLFFASEEGMERDDLRVLSVLTTWVEVHADRINVNRLVRLVQAHGSARVRAYWSAVGAWAGTDRRYRRLEELRPGRRVDLLKVGNDFQMTRRGEDPRFKGSALRVPAGVVRARRADVLDPAELSRRHFGYRSRLVQGPSYRADMWACLERDPSLTPSELARRTYGSFETARLTKRDFQLVNGTLDWHGTRRDSQ